MSEVKTWRQEPFWKAVWIYMRKPKGILIEDHEQLLADYASLEQRFFASNREIARLETAMEVIKELEAQLYALQWQPITESNLPKDREIVLVHGEGYYYVCVYRENLHSFQTREGREIYPSRFKSINPPDQEPK